MKKIALFIIFSFLTVLFATDSQAIKNPFISQLPKKVEKVVEKKKPTPRPTTRNSREARNKRAEQAKKQEVKPPPKVVPPVLQVSGVIWNSSRNQAIINGAVVDEGDEVAQVKILKINKTRIDFEFSGKKFHQDL